MISSIAAPVSIERSGDCWRLSFQAMASPCEILIARQFESKAQVLADIAHAEATRIERKYSRYLDGNIVHAINMSRGKPVRLDEETSRLLKYAAGCFELSEGLFDVTSGVLRQAWQFDGREQVPDQAQIDRLRKLVGWQTVRLDDDTIQQQPGMEIDFGGIGKEYAVDRVAESLFAECGSPLMVNFGGDIRAIGHDSDREPWLIGIESPDPNQASEGHIILTSGAVATSGVSCRYCMVNGKRLGHILNPRTGWPAEDSPQSVTVIADRCMEAGFLSTVAMLHGSEAETFLKKQGVKFHCVR